MNEPEVMLDMLGGRPCVSQVSAPQVSAPQVSAPRSAGARTWAPRTLAVVGLSDDPTRPSYGVSAYMQMHGYRILPVNPAVSEVLGERCYPTLSALPERPDVVNVFRLPRFIPGIVDEMLVLGLRNLWVQLGIRNPQAAAYAESNGVRVVMDRCILIEHRRLLQD